MYMSIITKGISGTLSLTPIGEMLLRRVEDAEGVSNGEKRSDDLAGLLYEFQRVCIDSIYSCTLNDRLKTYGW